MHLHPVRELKQAHQDSGANYTKRIFKIGMWNQYNSYQLRNKNTKFHAFLYFYFHICMVKVKVKEYGGEAKKLAKYHQYLSE